MRTLNGAIAQSLRSPDLQRRFSALAFEPATSSSKELASYVRVDIEKWKRVLQSAGLELQ